MVFLQRTAPINPRKRPSPPGDPPIITATGAASNSKGKARATAGVGGGVGVGDDQHISTTISLLADAGCTLHVSADTPPSLPADLHKLRRHLESRLSSDPTTLSNFLSGFSSYIRTPKNLRRVLIPAFQDGVSAPADSLARVLLLVAPIQKQIQHLLLEKLPEYFDSASGTASLKDDVARLIVGQFRWLDFLVDAQGFSEKLMEVLSICPLQLKKEIIGSLPEIIGEQVHCSVVAALEQLLQEDSEVIVPVLDSFSNLNMDDQLQEQAVTIALSCIRTIDAEHMPHLLRFLLLSATPTNVGRIISQIREQLKFVGTVDPRGARQKKLKGKSLVDTTEASILDALSSSLRFKNILCDAILKELKSLDQPRDHKVIDVWLLMLIYTSGGSKQKSVEKILKKKIIEGCFRESLFDQCIHGHHELVKDYFSSFLSVCEHLLVCKEQQARDFGIHLYTSLFEEFSDTYSRQEVLGALVTHIGSGIGSEVSSALETMTLLSSKYSEELIPISSHINGILDYLEGFNEENLHKVYEVFCHLALCARSSPDSFGSSIANELLMIVRKQVSNSDMKYRRMGIIGTLKIVSSLGDVNAATGFSSSQKTNSEEALELLKMSIDSCKSATLPLILLYDELIHLLEHSCLQPTIIEWVGQHVGEFESLFLSDLEGGKLVQIDPSDSIEGELWMNLDGDLSPVCLNILQLLASSLQQGSSSLQFLPSQFLLLCVVERLTNQGSLGGIDALLGCPLHLPSPKYFVLAYWKKLTGKKKQIVCFSLYFAVNWIRELLNAFSTQVAGRVDSVSQSTRDETAAKLLKRLRNLVLMESLLNAFLKLYFVPLPELQYTIEHSGSPLAYNFCHTRKSENKSSERTTSEGTQNNKKKRKKDTISSGKLDPKQPTIVDAFRKTAVVSQEVTNESSSGNLANGKTSNDNANPALDSSELGLVEISTESKVLDKHRSKFRPLRVDCLSLLSFSQIYGLQIAWFRTPVKHPRDILIGNVGNFLSMFLCSYSIRFHVWMLHQCDNYIAGLEAYHHDASGKTGATNSCCSDPAAELPLHLYLLRDLHNKLDCLDPPSKQFPVAFSVQAPPTYCRMRSSDFLNKIRPLFKSLKKHFDCALSILKNGCESCQDHWSSQSSSAGNPDIPYTVVSNSLVASSVFREILCCYSKMLRLPDLFLQTNLPVLRDMLEAFHSIEKPDEFFSGLQPVPSPGNMDSLYSGVFSFLENVFERACSFSFFLASEVLVTLQSLLNSVGLLVDKSMEGHGKNMHVGSFQRVLPFLRKKLGVSAHKLLVHDCEGDNENGLKNKGDMIEKILQIYLKNSESTSDLLDELACSILPQVPSSKTKNTQEVASSFPTLCPTMFLTWYRVLHEENLNILNKLVKENVLKSRTIVQREDVKKVLMKLRQSVNVAVSLVNMCKAHEKVAVHAMAVKYGGKFVDTFLKAFDFLHAQFQAHHDVIIQMVKELQKATRIIQTLCSEAKGSKRTMVTSKIPATKRSMERFLFHVKALLHNTSNGCTFWMGNLKHKDLHGQVVSSQVYAGGDDASEEAQDLMGEDDEDPADTR